MDVVSGSGVEITMSGIQVVAATGQAVVVPTDNMTFPQLTGILVFVIAIVVGCMIGNALFRRF